MEYGSIPKRNMNEIGRTILSRLNRLSASDSAGVREEEAFIIPQIITIAAHMKKKHCHGGARRASDPWTAAVSSLLALVSREYP